MNGNNESTASVQPSGGSVVDGPSASTITSPSSNGGARTAVSEDDSVSQSNGETQLSEQMQQLSIRQDTTIQSNQPSLPELRAYCQSDSLTEHGLRERLSHLELQGNDSTYDILLIDICANDCVTCEMVQCVIKHVPGAASVKTTGGRTPRGSTPLHFVCKNKNVTLDIFRCVLDSYPGALRTQDEFGLTPLVSLCCNRALNETVAVEILTCFLETCPESAQCSTHDGFLPIHFACRNCSPKFCWKLIQAYPESIRHNTALGEPLLFHVLFTSSVDDSVALAVLKMLLEKHSDMVRDVRWNGQSLLQYAASNHLPRAVEVCRLLIQAFPELLELGESDYQPLHIACLYGNLPVVKCILDMHPDAIRGESSDGSFPIHNAIGALRETPLAAVEVVKFLLTFDPSVAAQEVIGFPFPLIYACLKTTASNLSSGLEVIKLLYNAYPEAIVNAEEIFRRLIDINETPDDVKYFLIDQLRYAAQASNLELVRTQDENGMLPLHRALLEVAPLGAVKLLVQADPATIQIPDNHGALPSHIACEYHECPDVVKYLLDLHTRSLLVADNRGNTPLHCACLAVNYHVIEMILLQYPNAPVDVRNLNLNDGNGDGNGDLPIQILLGYDDDESVGYASCIYLLLRANPEMWMSNENLVLALTSDS
eukprot:scaffold4852_cov120-Skeletonema_dohrnii-CCMP3373.AAC.2